MIRRYGHAPSRPVSRGRVVAGHSLQGFFDFPFHSPSDESVTDWPEMSCLESQDPISLDILVLAGVDIVLRALPVDQGRAGR
jgi:hypothetical protein